MISQDCKHALGQCHSVLNSPDRNHCILKTWGTDRKTHQNNTFSNLNAQTPAKGERKNKKKSKWKDKKGYKKAWKRTHRVGVKCCEKNALWHKTQYGEWSAFVLSQSVSPRCCHVTAAALSGGKRSWQETPLVSPYHSTLRAFCDSPVVFFTVSFKVAELPWCQTQRNV